MPFGFAFHLSLNQQLTDRLEVLARAAALGLEVEAGHIEVDDDEILTAENQAIQWFDVKGQLLAGQGKTSLALPFNPDQHIQSQRTPDAIKALTVPVQDQESGQFIGYARVSESLDELSEILQRLDWGAWYWCGCDTHYEWIRGNLAHATGDATN